MKARLPASSMMVYLRGVPKGGQERTFQGVLDQANLVGGKVEVTADFPRMECPVLPIAAEAAVGFTGPYLAAPVWAPGIVTYRREEQFRHRYKFRFEDADQQLLLPVVNCRRAQRVRPDPNRPIPVGIKPLEAQLPFQGVMNDISATGVSILVPLEGEAKLFSAWAVEIAFRLPGVDGLLQFAANVCYRRLAGEYIYYGIDFDPKNTAEFEAKHTKVNAFVNSGLAQRQPASEN